MKLAYIALVVLLGYGYGDAAKWTDMKMPHPTYHPDIKGVTSVSASDTFGTWVTTNLDEVWVKKTQTGPWEQADPSLRQISVSNSAMWGVNKYGTIFWSASKNPKAGWMKVHGPPKMKQISVSDSGEVWGLASNGDLFHRKVGYGNLYSWTAISKGVKSVSVGHSGVWAVARNGAIYYRPGSYGGDKVGGKWKRVSGWLMKIISTNGYVLGVNKDGDVYKRVITSKKQAGTKWEKLNLKANSIAAKSTNSATTLFGIVNAKLMKTLI